jgi:predicted TIM-barrel fold metal-dependent hydrolase
MIPLDQFRPQPRLRVVREEPQRAIYPVVDVHTHPSIRLRDDPEALSRYVEQMDRMGIALSISLDGGIGERLVEHIRLLESRWPNRFVVFCHLDFQGGQPESKPELWPCNQPDFVRRCVEQLREAKRVGACGMKVFKQWGLGYRNADGSLVRLDDPRWDPIWEECGKLGFPILMHTADPSAFFEPIDARNERFEELSRRPQWAFPPDRFPTREELLEARLRVVARHPQTRFIAAHLGNDGEDLQQAAGWLDQYPNLLLEIASRISELGRQPYSAKEFLERYSDRILFGTDGPWPAERLRRYWQFLQTRDEYFPYSEKEFPPQGLWQIYGVDLSDQTLRNLYYRNAMRWVPGVQSRIQTLGLPVDLETQGNPPPP